MIYGVCGLAGSGKDTFADIVIKQNPNYIKVKMALILKNITAELFGWDRQWLEGETPESRKWRESVDEYWNAKVNENLRPFTPRKAMQFLGTDLGRNQISPELWVASIELYISSHHYTDVIIPDCRFPEELKMVKRLGGKIVEIRRNPPQWFNKLESYYNGADIEYMEIQNILNFQHPSETSWISFPKDIIIENDSTIEDLTIKVNNLVNI